jgi:hypothetical protein
VSCSGSERSFSAAAAPETAQVLKPRPFAVDG